jgi:EmrB/QacA subfamily drug resistance transporter
MSIRSRPWPRDSRAPSPHRPSAGRGIAQRSAHQAPARRCYRPGMAAIDDRAPERDGSQLMSVASTRREPNRWAVLALLSVAQLMVVLDATIVTIAIPSAQNALHFSTQSRQWIVTAYALAFGSLLLLGGKLGDLFGRKWTLIGGLVGFSIASAIGGLAQSFGVLVAARTLQGAFGALLAPSALGLLTVTFAGSPDRNTAFGIFGAIAGGGASLGLILGGALTQVLSWRWCLYVNLVIAAPATIAALRLVVDHRAGKRDPIDIPGALTSALGLFALVYGFSNAETHSWSATATIVALVASPVLLTAFVLIERKAEHPLLPLHIVWDRGRGGAYTTIALSGAGVFAVFLFLTYFLQQQRGLAPLTTGLAFLPLTGVLVVTSTIVQTRVIQHTGVKPLVLAGTTLAAIAMFLFTRLTPGSSYATDVLPGLLVLGVGMGFIFAPAFSTATLGVEGPEAGIASAMVNTSQQVGGSVGTSLLSTIFASAVASYLADHLHTRSVADAAAVHGYTTAFGWSVGIFALAFLLAIVILPGRAKPRVPSLRAALARLAIGNCHHFEAADAAGHVLDPTPGAAGR